jgi:hypothetical protein
MHPRLEELDRYLIGTRHELQQAVDSVPEHERATSPRDGAWSVLAVLEHLAIVESRVAALLAARAADARDKGLGPDGETTAILPELRLARFLDRGRRLEAPAGVHPKGEGDLAERWSALERSRAAVRDAIARADGLALADITAPHPIVGPLNMYEWIGFVGAHELRHADQIREIGASFAGRVD